MPPDQRDDEDIREQDIELDPFVDADDTEPEPEPEATEAKEPEPKKREEPAEQPAQASDLAAVEKAEAPVESEHEKGLRKELEKSRRREREWGERFQALENLARLNQRQATPANDRQEEQAAANAQAAGLPIEYDDDGRPYVPQTAIKQLIEESTRPDPKRLEMERRTQEYHSLRQRFVRDDPARETLIQRAEQAKELAEQTAFNAAKRRGIDPASIRGPDQVVAFLRETGAIEEGAAQFPDIGAELLEDIVFAAYLGSSTMMERALNRYAASSTQPAGADDDYRPAAEHQAAKLHEPPDDKPRNMARRGGAEPRGQSSKQSRFKHLTDKLSKDPMALTDDEYNELVQLEKELEAA